MPRLLVVDDHRDSLEMLELILGKKYSVASSDSAAGALAVLRTARPDLLILDIGMVPVDGLHLLGKIREMAGFARTPAIALTGFARDVDRQRFLDAGFQAVVAKPILDHRQLELLIDRLMDPVLTRGRMTARTRQTGSSSPLSAATP